MRLRPFLVVSSVVLSAALGAREPAPGVRIGLTYAPGTRPGVYILPMRGAGADSVRGIVARDLDHGDRVAVIAPEGGVVPSGPLNYALYQRLGAAAVLQMTMPGDGSLQVALHELVSSTVRNSQRFVLPQPAFGPGWRLAVHRVADEVERWVTGQQGVAATRVPPAMRPTKPSSPPRARRVQTSSRRAASTTPPSSTHSRRPVANSASPRPTAASSLAIRACSPPAPTAK